jgi:uncharacterized delta-60 repeat protein
MFIRAFGSNGLPDTSFGSQGIVLVSGTDGSGSRDYGCSIIVDALNRIIVSGYSENSNGGAKMAIWRFDPDGSTDTSWSDGKTSGYVLYADSTFGIGNARGYAAAFDPVGKVIVAGHSAPVSASTDDGRYMTVWRYLSNGQPDPAFGNGGVVQINGTNDPHSDDRGRSIAQDALGRIIVGGQSTSASGGTYLYAVWRLK